MKMASKSSTNTSAMDSRKELSELIKRKAEISVKYCLFTFANKSFTNFIKLFSINRLILKVLKDKSLHSKDHT